MNMREDRPKRPRCSTMRRWSTWTVTVSVALLVLLALPLLFGGCGGSESAGAGSTAVSPAGTAPQESVSPITASGLPKLVDLGSDSCVPCQMMAPELEALAQEYVGSLEVVVVDVTNTEEGASLAKQLRIRVIPTQIWFDPEGNELLRHEGYLSKEDIVSRFEMLGYPLSSPGAPSGYEAAGGDESG